MKAAKTVFLCSNCGNETPRWQGRCPSCGQWNTLEEYTPPQAAAPSRSSLSNRTSAARGVGVQPKRLNEVTSGRSCASGPACPSWTGCWAAAQCAGRSCS